MRILPEGRSAILVELDDLRAAMALYSAIPPLPAADGPLTGVTEAVPASRTVLVRFDPTVTDADTLSAALRGLETRDAADEGRRQPRTVAIPVVYDGEDLPVVADLLGISEQEVIRRHTGTPWTAAFCGFAPGFAYLTGGDAVFDVPRRDDPRLSVPAGAVGLAGTFSGVYPRPSSGGWRLIGVTDIPMWDERRDPPALVRPGDLVRFEPARPRIHAAASGGNLREESPHAPSGDDMTTDDDMTTGLIVDDPGMFAAFEDAGRHAATLGVTGSGAADPQAMRLANRLVGNPGDEPVIEAAGGGLRLTAVGDVVLAVAGAPAAVTIHGADGARTAISAQEPFLLTDGEHVDLGVPDHGWRDYVALQGGFAVGRVLGSASSDTLSALGPAPLSPGVRLHVAGHAHGTVDRPRPWPEHLPGRGDVVDLEAVPGPRDDWFTAQGLADLFDEEWTVDMRSDRVGLRLHARRPLERAVERELPSEGMMPGAIEVPANGQPVLLLRDRPVTGGYPVIAVLTERSLALAGQLRPGVRIRFRRTPAGTGGNHGREDTGR